MPKRKRVVIKASEWGANYLFDPENETMCCLGFACLAEGVDQQDMTCMIAPREADVFLFEKTSSPDLKQKAKPLIGRYNADTLSQALAHINDFYHEGKITLDKALPILRQGFREAGLTLVYRADL